MTTATLPASDHARFLRSLQDTRWSLVQRIRNRGQRRDQRRGGADPADELCRIYWEPLVGLLRRSGMRREDAEDCLQSFWLKIFGLRTLEKVRRTGCRFRYFLATCLIRHRDTKWQASRALKRGGGRIEVSLDSGDTLWAESVPSVAAMRPDRWADVSQAFDLARAALEAVRREYRERGRLEVFDSLISAIEGPVGNGTYEELSGTSGATALALRVAASRLRKTFHSRLRELASRRWGIRKGPALDCELKRLFVWGD